MGSIVGAGVKISHAKKKRRASKASGRYLSRNNCLPYLGYSSYREYLQSSDWKIIRKTKLEQHPRCECCDEQAFCVHHYCYSDSVMLGLYLDLLISICDRCHTSIEFIDDYKLPLERSQKELHKLLKRNGKRERSQQIHKLMIEMRQREQVAMAISKARR